MKKILLFLVSLTTSSSLLSMDIESKQITRQDTIKCASKLGGAIFFAVAAAFNRSAKNAELNRATHQLPQFTKRHIPTIISLLPLSIGRKFFTIRRTEQNISTLYNIGFAYCLGLSLWCAYGAGKDITRLIKSYSKKNEG